VTSERAVLYFRELLSNKKKFSFRRVESEKIGSTDYTTFTP